MKPLLVNQAKKSYSYYVRQLSKKASKKPLKRGIVYLLSFPNNNHGLIESLNEIDQVTVCYTKERADEAELLKENDIRIIPIDSISGLKKTIEVVTTSKIVIADNYFPFLGDIYKRGGQSFFQIWHATGAIKQFGLEDKAIKKRTIEDQARFQRVYDSFDYYVVGSEKMGDVFKRSYGAKDEQLLYLGFPRTDALIKQASEQKARDIKKEKKKIVYLPTYRLSEKTIDLSPMIELIDQLGDGYEMAIKTHPHVVVKESEQLHPNIRVITSTKSADKLIIEADCLITDYSSTAFDYALINPTGQLIFYWYDETSYLDETGLQPTIKETLPDAVCHTIEEIAKQIKTDDQDLTNFNQNWNTYNDGFSTKRLIEIIKEKMS